MRHFSVPATYKIRHIPFLKANGVVEVYGSIGNRFFRSVRDTSELRRPKIGNVKRYIDRLHRNGIKFSFVMNSPVFEEFERVEFGKSLKKLKSIGVDNVIVADFSIIPEVLRVFDKDSVMISVVSEISRLNDIKSIEKYGIKRIALDPSINKNIRLISSFMRRKIKPTLLVNEGCQKGCPYRNNHYSCISSPEFKGDLFRLWCICNKDTSGVSGTWILPEELISYDMLDGIVFKISGRDYPDSWILGAIKAYSDARPSELSKFLTGSSMKRSNPYVSIFSFFPGFMQKLILHILVLIKGKHDIRVLSSLGAKELSIFVDFLANKRKKLPVIISRKIQAKCMHAIIEKGLIDKVSR